MDDTISLVETPSLIEAISLLEQCILYSDPKFTLFQPCVASEIHTATSSRLEPEADSGIVTVLEPDGIREGGPAADENAAKSASRLLNIDLNFEIPLTEEQYITRVITPLVRSTNRRSGTWKISKRIRRYVPRDRSRSRKKSKQKPNVSSLEPRNIVNTVTMSTKAEFMSLPGEVRNLIYGHLFDGARVFINQNPVFKCSMDLHLAIRSTCKTIYAETSKSLFNRLTVMLNHTTLKSKDSKQIGEPVPDHILNKLESLEIMVPQHGGSGAGAVTLKQMPKLQRLKFIEVDLHSFVGTDWNIMKQTQNVTSMIQNPEEHLHHWLGQLGALKNRSFSVTYELEFWTTSVEDRAAHMGALQKTCYNTILLTCSENEGDARVTRLDLEQFQRRYEGCCRMEKDSVRIRQGSHANKVLQKLENMRYHAALDRMESGITRFKTPKKVKE